MQFKEETVERATRALRLSPITARGIGEMATRSVPAGELAGLSGADAGLTRAAMTPQAVEEELMWLFRVGIVRREVDGQGITDRFRLTPLGQRVLEGLSSQENGTIGLGDQLQNWVIRWLG